MRQRVQSGVPPPDAFDNLPRRKAPNLPGPGQPLPAPVATLDVVDGGKKGRGKPRAQAAAPVQGIAQPGQPGVPAQKRSQRPASPARRRRRRRMAAALAGLLLIALGVWFSITVWFKIEKFDMAGNAGYTLEEVVAAFGLEPGDNLFGFVKQTAEQRIQERLPYIESVSIKRRLPSTILFQVSPAKELCYLDTGAGFAVLSSAGKVLRVAEQQPEGLIQIYGLQQVEAVPGQQLVFLGTGAVGTAQAKAPASAVLEGPVAIVESGASANENSVPTGESGEDATSSATLPEEPGSQGPQETYAVLNTLLAELEKTGLADIRWVDVSDPLDLRFNWEGRITVRLGLKSGMAEKLSRVKVILTDEEYQMISPGDRGTLDMGLYQSTGACYFTPE